jgi:DNA modification methylase
MSIQIIVGDAIEVMRTMPAASVQTCITSVPYYAQRSYLPSDHPRKAKEIGLEATVEEFLAAQVEVFREVRRLLRKDGTLWLNIGDTASSGGRGGGGSFQHERAAWAEASEVTGWRETAGLHRKNMLMIPARLALALQADGWVLRSEIIWSKPNAFPESVNDRPTRSHEQIYLFAKSHNDTIWRARDTGEWSSTPDRSQMVPNLSRVDDVRAKKPMVKRWQGFDYYYDADAIMEPSSPNTHARAARGRSKDHKWADGGPGDQSITKVSPSAGRVPKGQQAIDGDVGRVRSNSDFSRHTQEILPMRNKRSVWEVHTAQYGESHFATFPPALIEPCILAGAPRCGVVLDPFAGSGTVGEVADRHGRSAILIDIDERNVRMMEGRLKDNQRALLSA